MKLTFFKTLRTSFLSRCTGYLIALLLTTAAIVLSVLFYTETSYLLFTLIVIYLIFRLNQRGWHDIPDNLINYCLCCVNFALLHVIAGSMTYVEMGIERHAYGYLAACFASSLFYWLSPYLVYKLRLDRKMSPHSFASFFCVMLFCFVPFAVNQAEERYNITEARFAKVSFVNVDRWSVETYRGETCYIVTCYLGTFSVSPYLYPEIREINSRTQIRILINSQYKGLLQYDRLEIKN